MTARPPGGLARLPLLALASAVLLSAGSQGAASPADPDQRLLGETSTCEPERPPPLAPPPGAPPPAPPGPAVDLAQPPPRVSPRPATVAPPNPRVQAFYYPWYRNPATDGAWVQWGLLGRTPPLDLAADFYPLLGPYSSNQVAVLDQHMRWMRQAGIGVVVVSWSGVGHPTNQPIPAVLDAAQRQGLKVAWQIEPYAGRGAGSVARDIAAITAAYGSHPAFFRVSRSTPYAPTDAPRAVFYVFRSCEIPPAAWRATLGRLRADRASAPIVLGQTTDACSIDGCGDLTRESRFDGLYSYDGLGYDGSTFDDIAGAVSSRGAIFSPSVAPGYSARRAGVDERGKARYGASPGCRGYTYDCLWQGALAANAEWVSITSFNEWHEGTQIEPAAESTAAGAYASYGGWPELYLDKTARYVLGLTARAKD